MQSFNTVLQVTLMLCVIVKSKGHKDCVDFRVHQIIVAQSALDWIITVMCWTTGILHWTREICCCDILFL